MTSRRSVDDEYAERPPTDEEWDKVVANSGLIGKAFQLYAGHFLRDGFSRDELQSEAWVTLLRCVRLYNADLAGWPYYVVESVRRKWISAAVERKRWLWRKSKLYKEYRRPNNRRPGDAMHVAAVAELVAGLGKKLKTIVACRWGVLGVESPMTLEQTGKLVGLTRERVRQLGITAMRKLRDEAARKHIKTEDVFYDGRGRPAVRVSKTPSDPSPGWENAVRAIEDYAGGDYHPIPGRGGES